MDSPHKKVGGIGFITVHGFPSQRANNHDNAEIISISWYHHASHQWKSPTPSPIVPDSMTSLTQENINYGIYQHREAETKWSTFCRQYFHMDFLERKHLYFYEISAKFDGPKWQIHHYWLKQWLGAKQVPSHQWNQCWQKFHDAPWCYKSTIR